MNRRADDRKGKEKETETRVRMSKEVQGHGPRTQKTRTGTETKRLECIYILTNDKQQRARSRLQPNRPANRCRCLLVSAKGEIGWRCCRKHTGVPQSSASLPKPARKKAVELWRMKEREASGFGPTTLRPLYARSPLSPLLLPFIASRREPFPSLTTHLTNLSS